jgi:hypothetical protein
MNRRASLATLTAVLFILPASLLVLPAGATLGQEQEGVRIDAATRLQIVDHISGALNGTYVFLETAREMEAMLRSNLDSGEYDRIEIPFAFAMRLTRDLQAISHDKHLRVRSGPPLAEREQTEFDPAARREALRRQNYRFRTVEVLEGNIGYLRFDNFIDASMAGDTAVAAMNFLANVDALIIDLRYNGGGSPSMIQLISAYFFEEPQHLNSFYIRSSDSWQHFWTEKEVKGPKLVDVPIYVLTSNRTFSAAEEFTYNLKNMERATIVGETTGGGAHPVRTFNFDMDSFSISATVPFGRAVNPITGTNWEGTGIEPHIKVAAGDALDTAIEEAKKKVGG